NGSLSVYTNITYRRNSCLWERENNQIVGYGGYTVLVAGNGNGNIIRAVRCVRMCRYRRCGCYGLTAVCKIPCKSRVSSYGKCRAVCKQYVCADTGIGRRNGNKR